MQWFTTVMSLPVPSLADLHSSKPIRESEKGLILFRRALCISNHSNVQKNLHWQYKLRIILTYTNWLINVVIVYSQSSKLASHSHKMPRIYTYSHMISQMLLVKYMKTKTKIFTVNWLQCHSLIIIQIHHASTCLYYQHIEMAIKLWRLFC